ncbi:MAG TPA: YibE/F family protein [Marmoricola sp.]|nr:YibE/F family protein [Marmoricola sp.]
MGHGHSHVRRDAPVHVDVARGPLMVLTGFLVLCAVAAIVGVVGLWPDSAAVNRLRDQAQFTAPGVTFQKARVETVQPLCANSKESSPTCGNIEAVLTTGPEKGQREVVGVPPPVTRSGVGPGDTVRLMRVPGQGQPTYSFDEVIRLNPLWFMIGFFVVVVAVVARKRGVLALVALAFAGFVLVRFMLPALLSGSNGLAVSLVGSAAIMFVVLYLAHGPSVRTSAALAGTLVGIGITAVVGVVAVHGSNLSGSGSEDTALLSSFAGNVSFQGLLTCALVVAGLGVLNDVTITQASSVWELREAGPELSRSNLFASAMRIGRDHIASTIYTIVFAYAGSALAVLLLLTLYDRPVLDLLSTEAIAEEIVRTLASGIGLVLAVPATTAIAVLTVAGPRREGARRAE